MSDIAYKSTGFLIDEFLTTTIKLRVFPGNLEVATKSTKLANEILLRLDNGDTHDREKLADLIVRLEKVLKTCWDAQEDVMDFAKSKYKNNRDFRKCAIAAVTAQRYNAKRNKLIREIDTLLGELDRSVTEKTYA